MDFPTPDGSSQGFNLGKGEWAIWIGAGLVALLVIFLIIDALLTWRKNQKFRSPTAKRIRFSLLRRFLAWLFYPSFQRHFEDND